MSLLIHKYGGTSVDGPERIRAVARRVADARQAGHGVVVVVSAMGQSTDELLQLADQVSPNPAPRELDMLVTAGERITMSLLAMALNDLSVKAISFTGSQSGILTDGVHRSARITQVRGDRIREELERQRVVIVAGFQGVNPETREITTLGRGGSDTTAVALAASLGAARCEIYTDVAGVMTADPRIVAEAQVIPTLSYELCATIAHLGGQVLHGRSVDLAAARGVTVIVRSAFEDSQGTRIEEVKMEGGRVVAVTHRENCSLAIAEGTSGGRGETRGILDSVTEAYPELELIAREQATQAHGAIIWMGSQADCDALKQNFRELRGPGGEWKLDVEHGAGFVSIVGLGLGAREASRAEAVLEKSGVQLIALRVTPTAIIMRVPGTQCAAAVKALHAAMVETTVTTGPGAS